MSFQKKVHLDKKVVPNKKSLDGNVETFLLLILEESPNYGYAIVRELKQKTDGLLRLGEGTVYPVLYRMEERGVLESFWQEGPNGRKRKYYRVAQKGKKALASNLSQWDYLVRVMETIRDNSNLSLHPEGGSV